MVASITLFSNFEPYSCSGNIAGGRLLGSFWEGSVETRCLRSGVCYFLFGFLVFGCVRVGFSVR